MDWRTSMRRYLFSMAFLPALAQLLAAASSQPPLHELYRDLLSNDWKTRYSAFKTIQSNEEYMKSEETASRLLALVAAETLEIRTRAVEGMEAGSEFYDEVLAATWRLWKDQLTAEAFRVFAEASYGPGSPFARELGVRAGNFVKELILLASKEGDRSAAYVRANATVLMGYALAADLENKNRLNAADRAALIQALVNASLDKEYPVRWAAIRSLGLAGGDWAFPILEEMRSREAAFHPAGWDPASRRAFESEVASALAAIRSRTGKR